MNITPGNPKPRQHINANVQVELYEALRKVAFDRHEPMNSLIVEALELYLADHFSPVGAPRTIPGRVKRVNRTPQTEES